MASATATAASACLMAASALMMPAFAEFTAAADLSAKQFFCVKVTAENAVNLAGAGEAVDGVLQNKPTSGQEATVWGVGSTTKAVAGAAVAAGADVTPDANGKLVTAGTGDYILGRALFAASADLERISVFITNQGRSA